MFFQHFCSLIVDHWWLPYYTLSGIEVVVMLFGSCWRFHLLVVFGLVKLFCWFCSTIKEEFWYDNWLWSYLFNISCTKLCQSDICRELLFKLLLLVRIETICCYPTWGFKAQDLRQLAFLCWWQMVISCPLFVIPGSLMKFFLLLSVQCYFWMHYASGSTLWRENLVVNFWTVLLQVAFVIVSAQHWRASLFISLGTLVLLLHGTFGVKFVQRMISFHRRFGPFGVKSPLNSACGRVFDPPIPFKYLVPPTKKFKIRHCSSKRLNLVLWFSLLG